MTSDFSQILQGGWGGSITCTPFSSHPPEEALATAWCDVTDSLYSRLQCPQMMGWGWRGRGGDPVSDYAAGRQVGRGDQRCRQEVKIAQASRPSEPWSLVLSRPGPGLGSRSYSGAWESHIPWRKVPSYPPSLPPASSGCCRSLPCLQRKEGKGGPEGEEGRWGQAEAGQSWLSDADSLRSGPVEPL